MIKSRPPTKAEVHAFLQEARQALIDVAKRHQAGLQTFTDSSEEDWQKSGFQGASLAAGFVMWVREDADEVIKARAN